MAFSTPKPERLLSRIIEIATNPNDLVLDSFLGSGTTAAVAHKMGRRWIGIEMGEHALTHCLPRLQKVVAGEQGHAKRLVCPYHGWSYDLAGTLKVVPDEADFVQGSPCGKLNLVEVKCETWAGFVWINMDKDAAPLRQFMGPIADQIDTYPMDAMVRTHWVTIEGNFNWKLVQDNFNESYHVPFVHPQTKFIMEYAYSQCQFDLYPEGHARMFMPGAGPTKQLRGGEAETLEMLREELEFWDLDPEQFRGGRTGEIRKALQALEQGRVEQVPKRHFEQFLDFRRIDSEIIGRYN